MNKILERKKTHFTFSITHHGSSIAHYVVITLPIILLWLLYGVVIQYGWWTGDDTAILYSTVKNGILKHFYYPQIWRTLSATNLTPWVNLSFGLDWHLFGFHAKGFYIHQLISFSFVLIFCYLAISEFLPPVLTLVVLILFITSRPAACFAGFLWVRHYLEGLGLAALSFWLFIKSVKTKKIWISILGSFFYCLAMTAKELYVPLVVLLLFLPFKTTGQKRDYNRFQLIIPYIISAVIYVIWRLYMLGLHSALAADIPETAFCFKSIFKALKLSLLGFSHAMDWAPYETGVLAILLLGLGIRYFKQYPQKLPFFILWMVLIITPLLPVVNFLRGNPVSLDNLRILIVCVMSFYIVWGVILKEILSLQKGTLIASIVFCFLISVNIHSLMACNYRRQVIDVYKAHKITGSFILSNKKEAILVNLPTSSWFYVFLKKLAVITNQISKEESTPKICGDICLCLKYINSQTKQDITWWEYKEGKIVPIDINKVKTCIIYENKPLWVRITYKNGIIKWELGPYDKGSYFFLGSQQNLPTQAYGLPARGIAHVFLKQSLYFWVRYDSPEGWRTYSSFLHLKPINGQARIYWQRRQH